VVVDADRDGIGAQTERDRIMRIGTAQATGLATVQVQQTLTFH
jgi:hypothetical protein